MDHFPTEIVESIWGTQIDRQQREHAQSRPQRLSFQASPPSAAERAPGRILPGSAVAIKNAARLDKTDLAPCAGASVTRGSDLEER